MSDMGNSHMNTGSLSREEVSSFIDNILKSKDPATVGLRKILRKNTELERDFSVYSPAAVEFDTPERKSRVLSEDEQRILELEKKVIDLEGRLEKQKESARQAVQAAFVKGRTEGLEEGLARGREETTEVYEKKIDQLQQKIESIIRQFDESRRTVFSGSEHLLLRLCCEMVRKVISTEVTVNQNIILSVLKKALTYIGDRERLVVRVSPDDFETVSGRKDFWVPVAESLKNVSVESDERVSRGGCIIESNSGVVDARLGVQFEEISGLVESVWENINSSLRDPRTVDLADNS